MTLGAAAALLDVGCSDDDAPATTDAGADVSTDVTASDVVTADTTPQKEAGTCADSGTDLPDQLECTGLYSDFAAKTVAAQNRAYTPGLVFWSDGAEKSRWLYLPPGTKIDTTDMDEWVFPVGTKAWKEFRIAGKRIETRMFVKNGPDDWAKTTYRWNADDSAAKRLKVGAKNVVGTYEIPDETMCEQCHGGRKDKMLGFEAVSLALPTASGLTLTTLKAENLLTAPPATTTITLPSDDAGVAGPALGWLHINCGVACHNAAAPGAGFTGFHMRLSAKAWLDGGVTTISPTETDTYKTGVNVVHNSFRGSYSPDAGYFRFKSGDETKSVAIIVDGLRDQPNQMPPIATHAVDDAGVSSVKAWIKSLPP
ncbi:MAG: hypothetical protein JWM74_5877 [Myxococcaceae bacterium]|nr:hypothetical protein [Myxococcaceae bacterium]